ncbi:hypothetical protein [Noviluteimonas gilva]|uniref:DUF2189 domain-containing protein n=1 Tax=Noviluteimonas gilva TaxID=2682097 RepID=A0A7C9LHJ7_9GAMM|nr:hypothetical protein [Lysobacter gilvus]MUV14961.1 hypothetical protein [Lysobacter gilvus]
MATRMTSPLAGIRWLRDAINLGARNPRTLVLAAALVLVCGIVPSLITTGLQFLFPNNQAMFVLAIGLSALIGLALAPVFAGFLQVIHAIETGQPTHARAIFAPYHTGVWKPVIGFSLLMWIVYAIAFALVVWAAGPEIRQIYADLLAASASGTEPMPMEPMPPGFMRAFAVGGVCGLLIGGIWTIGYGQIAIARRPVIASLIDGIVGTLKNIPALIVLLLAAALLSIALVIVFVIIVTVLGLIAKFVGGWLAMVLLVPLYIALALGIYIVMFGLAYAMWRDICAR